MLIEKVDKKNGKITLMESGFGTNGGRYDFEKHLDKYDGGGTIKINKDVETRLESYYNRLLNGNPIERLCLIRIITDGKNYIDKNNQLATYDGISASSKTRLSYPNIDIEKTVTISNNVKTDSQAIMANLNDLLTYNITIKNSSNESYQGFEVVENIDSRLNVVDKGNGTLTKGKLKWNISSLEAGKSISLSYTVKVPAEKSLLGKIIVSTGRVENVATSRIETLIGNKLSADEKTKLLNSFNNLKNNSQTEREFLNAIYLDALNINLGISNLENLDIMSFDLSLKSNGKQALEVKSTKLNDTPVKKYIFQNFYGLRIAGANNEKESLVRAILQWNVYPEYELNDRAKTLTKDMLEDGDILLVYTGSSGTTDEKLVNKSYIYLQNKLIRKISSSKYEEISGTKLTTFLRNIVCDNFVLLRPAIAMESTVETTSNYTINGVGYNTLSEAYQSITGESGIIKVEQDCTDSSKLEIATGKNITIDTNGKTITKTSNGIINNGTLTITGSGIITTKNATTNTIRNLITTTGTLNLKNGIVQSYGTLKDNFYTIYVPSGIINVSGGEIKSYLNKDSKNIDAALNVKATAKITGGTIVGTKYGVFSNAAQGDIYISAGNITANNDAIHIGGENASTKVTILGGNIKSKENDAIFNNGTGKTIIGLKDGKVSTNTPSIQGMSYAVNVTSEFEFYDGILKGKDASHVGKITIENNYVLQTEKDSNNYITTTLKKKEDKNNYMVDNQYYETLEKAYAAITGDTGNIEVQKDYVDKSNFEIAKGKKITLSMNGKTITKTIKGITNNGTLTIIGKGTITTSKENNTIRFLITNKGELNIKSGKIINTGITTDNSYTIYSPAGLVNITSGTIESILAKGSKNFDAAINVKSRINISGGTIKGTTYGIFSNNAAAEINITGGNVVSEDSAIKINGTETQTTMVITGGTVKSNQKEAISNEGKGNIRIGIKNEKYSYEKPIIHGKTYAIKTNYRLAFYDGIMQAKSKVYTGNLVIEENFLAKEGTDLVDGENYKVLMLVSKDETGDISDNVKPPQEIEDADDNTTGKPSNENEEADDNTPKNPSNENEEADDNTPKNPSDENEEADDNTTVKPSDKNKEEKLESLEKQFRDVRKEHWYYEATEYVFNKGLFKGVEENRFAPNLSMNRAMIITVLHRLDGERKITKKNKFQDIQENSYYESAVNWAVAKEIVTGTSEETFSPGNNVSREQLVTILYRYAKYKGKNVYVNNKVDISSFEDYNQIAEYAIIPMKWAYKNGIITGRTESNLAPKGTATRAEVATMIMRFVEK